MECIVKHFNELNTMELYEILQARVNVFVVEQTCPYPELDNKDLDAYHVYLKDENGIQAYLRVLDQGVSYPEVSLGRVLSVQRQVGLGRQIFEKGMAVAKDKYQAKAIRIEAQVYAEKFYEKFGFRRVSEEFLEDGIWHVEMLWQDDKGSEY